MGQNERFRRIHERVGGVGLLTALFAGLIVIAINRSSDPSSVGELMELNAIAAVVVGGTPLTGGQINELTKSGSNNLQGSVNYFFQNDNLVAENKNASAETFSTKDSAFTIGGPLMTDAIGGQVPPIIAKLLSSSERISRKGSQ